MNDHLMNLEKVNFRGLLNKKAPESTDIKRFRKFYGIFQLP
jgi:hypothetical protein